MKVLILAAGYGTRMTRDLEASGQLPHLVGVPKPLLPVAGKPLISHWMDLLQSCAEIQEVYVVVNAANQSQFQTWASDYSQVQLVCEGSTHNDNRRGAVACIELSVNHFNVQDDLIVIGGDTLFFEDFSLTEFIDAFHQSPCKDSGGALVTFYRCKDSETSKCGILEIDDSGKVTSFLEKPGPATTQSRRACPCFYLFSRGALPLLSQFLEEKKDAPLTQRDAPGNFIKYLCSLLSPPCVRAGRKPGNEAVVCRLSQRRRAVYTKEFSGRFDVGGLQTYLQCCEQYKPHKFAVKNATV